MSLKEKCPVFYFDVKGDERGQMIVIEGGVDIPFDIKRMFYIYGSDTSVIRGQHANRESEFILINVHGTSKVKVRDGEEEMIVSLDAPMKGIYIPKMIWKDMYDFSEDSVLLVLASTHYIAEEYVRDYERYVSETCVCK
nr:FdtA/QdtA family cupin domain-containing protein [uncultured Blautia sp.]